MGLSKIFGHGQESLKARKSSRNGQRVSGKTPADNNEKKGSCGFFHGMVVHIAHEREADTLRLWLGPHQAPWCWPFSQY